MGQFVKIGTVAEFEDVEVGKLVDAGGRSLAVFKVGANYCAPIAAGLWRKVSS